MKDLERFLRVKLAALPTPIQKLENLSRMLGIELFVKRDDMTGAATGGNKVRKLEFLLAEAQAQGAEVIFTTGGAQSNHAMLTAACSVKLGMTPILILKQRGVTACRGNLLLEKLMGTEVRFMDTDSYDDIYREMDRLGTQMGKPYYKIPCGGSTGLGALGYVDCVREIAAQGLRPDVLVVAEGSGGTHAGTALGTALYLPDTAVYGVSVDTDPFPEITPAILREAAAMLEAEDVGAKVRTRHLDMTGPGYAVPSEEGNAAIRLMAAREGIFLDPVYTGKAFAGLLKMVRSGEIRPGAQVLFLHTGGIGGLFARDDL